MEDEGKEGAVCARAPCVWGAIFPLILLFSTPSYGQLTLGVASFSTEGELSESADEQFESLLVEALEEEGFDVLPLSEMARRASMSVDAMAQCTDEACLRGIFIQSGIHGAVRATIAGDLNIYSLSIEVISVSGRRLAGSESGCDLCTMAEFRATLRERTAAMADEIPRHGTVRFDIAPAEAALEIDGVLTVSREVRLPPGNHVITVTANGYDARHQDLPIWPGESDALTIALVALDEEVRDEPPVVFTAERRLRPLGISGVIMATSGTTLAIGGVIAFILNGRCAGGGTDAEGHCEFIYSTVASGAALVAAGGAAALAGIVLLVANRVRQARNTRNRSSSNFSFSAVLH